MYPYRLTKVPAYVYVMMVITFVYLTIEVPFSVHLIEFMGGNPSVEDIDAIEVFGRLLTGFAVAIFVLGSIVLPRVDFGWHLPSFNVAIIVLPLIASVGGTYLLLDSIANHMGSSSTAEERRIAFRKNIVKRHIAQHGVADIEAGDSNDWLTFVSAVPALGASVEQIGQMTNVSYADMIGGEGYRVLGDFVSARTIFAQRTEQAAEYIYERFQEGVSQYETAMRKLPGQARTAYREYDDAAKRKMNAMYYMGSKARKAQWAREHLRSEGLYFDSNQDPFDYSDFEPVFLLKHAVNIRAEFDKGVQKELGPGLKISPAISFEEFKSIAAVQKKIRSILNLPATTQPLNAEMSDADFAELIYEPLATTYVNEFTSAFDAPASDFADGGKFEELGVSAVKMTQVPVMAILLSIAGAMLHIYKLSTYVIQVVAIRKGIRSLNGVVRHALGVAVMATAFLIMGLSGNSITSNKAFAEMKETSAVSSLMQAAIAIQPDFSAMGRGLGMIGPWHLVAPMLPEPVLFAGAKATGQNIGKIPTPSPRPAVEGEGVVLNHIPIPTPRPDL